MGKKISDNLTIGEQINKIQDDLFLVSLKMKGLSKLFFPQAAGDGRDFDSEELNGLGEMILDFSKTITGIHDDVENYKLNSARKE